MEDAATAEISRTQLWQWLKNEVKVDNGLRLNSNMFHMLLEDELKTIEKQAEKSVFESENYQNAIQIFYKLVTAENFEEFLTTKAYKYL